MQRVGMRNIRKMHLVYLLSFWMVSLCTAEPPLPGSCSQKCENRSNATEDNLRRCSCSSSCAIYKDCCFDSHHRSEDVNVGTMCISLSTRGRFLAVSKCPGSWSGFGQFCNESIGHLPPVTSTTSGITYANLYCAVCNGDGEKLTTWNVELRCCPEHENSDGRRYIYRRGHLWSKVDNHPRCQCHYVSHRDDTSFADGLELRPCERSLEISRCSSSWDDDAVKKLCRAFVDPVYIGERIYRNIYCAQCNYERLDQAKCIPAIVERKISEGSNMTSIYEYCKSLQLSICLHYLDHLNKGQSYSFTSLLNIREEGCIPPNCCAGSTYDYKMKKCRRMVSSSRPRINLW